jgi:hypothetical protein
MPESKCDMPGSRCDLPESRCDTRLSPAGDGLLRPPACACGLPCTINSEDTRQSGSDRQTVWQRLPYCRACSILGINSRGVVACAGAAGEAGVLAAALVRRQRPRGRSGAAAVAQGPHGSSGHCKCRKYATTTQLSTRSIGLMALCTLAGMTAWLLCWWRYLGSNTCRARLHVVCRGRISEYVSCACRVGLHASVPGLISGAPTLLLPLHYILRTCHPGFLFRIGSSLVATDGTNWLQCPHASRQAAYTSYMPLVSLLWPLTCV